MFLIFITGSSVLLHQPSNLRAFIRDLLIEIKKERLSKAGFIQLSFIILFVATFYKTVACTKFIACISPAPAPKQLSIFGKEEYDLVFSLLDPLGTGLLASICFSVSLSIAGSVSANLLRETLSNVAFISFIIIFQRCV